MFDIKPGAVIHGDCLTVLRQMNAESVDMIITDPPYGVDYQSNRPKAKNPSARFKKIANDKAPFIWWLYDAFRILQDGGAPLFQPMGRAAGLYGRYGNSGLFRQVRAGLGSGGAWHG